MKRLRFLTAGESHGPALMGILEGLPAGLRLEASHLDKDLARRQMGYGRGGRMKIERDRAKLLGGLRFGKTLGSPLAVLIENIDHGKWLERMPIEPGAGSDPSPVLVPRPGHADLAGGLKYGHTDDLRNVLERASARETTMRVALGGAAKALLRELGVTVGSYVRRIGREEAPSGEAIDRALYRENAEGLAYLADRFSTRVLSEEADARLVAEIDEARKKRDTLGGVLEVVVTGLPAGLGSHVHWDRRLDAKITQALLSIPAMKAVEIGDGWQSAGMFGSEVHDPIAYRDDRLERLSNHAGGLEGGITNAEPLVVRVAMKPLSTVPASLPSVHLGEIRPNAAHVERTDTCAVPAAGVVAEAMVALAVADALLEVVGGDTLASMRLPMARLRLANRARLGHVFLLGPMGAGKTEAGLILSSRLGMPFIDLDAKIEARAETSIREIFATMGEAGFRALEAQTLAAICTFPPAVVALGGGAVVGEDAWRRMRQKGVAVSIHADPKELIRRLSQRKGAIESRPLLQGGDPEALLAEIIEARGAWYEKADLHLDTTGLTAEQVAGAIVGLLREVEGPLVPLSGGAGRGGRQEP